MGQARQRGSYEQRRENAIRRDVIKKQLAKEQNQATVSISKPTKHTMLMASLLAMGG